ncbi:conserved oligomeric Golgi complex subunit 1 isoform X2 [Malaya genurostris]|uniref:conserved oligomeric Golgi complex subunit 1 isoform X2 n=1 Tax=Malaya genurostris TaxID=325434 RepID=UPI0026F38764|nr:conserved oligomeric Golgi complex subunit 1 isoform X2 [Malaya genurostris]
MAQATNLLNINVDKLFEQHSVAEIDQIHKQLQAEVELKREELRTMVGERYRDLLKAADTIGDMKTTANSIIGNIDNITAACRQLNEHQLIGFRSEIQKKNINNKFYGIVVQIKLLTSLPEMIWSAIDNEDYFVATQLFIFSRHISTGLQLDSNSEIMTKFAVAKKQWIVLSQFFFTIKQNCTNCLEREDLTPEVAAKCLASLLLLENCQLDQVLTGFVQMRLKAFSGVLSDSSRHEKVKDKIVASLRLLMNTVELIYRCFIDTEQEPGLLKVELTSVTDESSVPTISLIRTEDPKIIQTLPDIICKFRPRLQLHPLSSELVRDRSQFWLQSVEKITSSQLVSFMNLVPSIKTLNDIRRLCQEAAKKPEQWNETCKTLSLPESLDFYNRFYQPLIDARAKSIIEASWSETVQTNCNDILELVRSTTTDKSFKSMKSFVWTESASDDPMNLKDALDRSKLTSHQLLMKTKAFPPALVKHTELLDQRVQTLSKDVSFFLETCNASESDQFTAFYSEISVDSISQLITSIKSAKYEYSLDSLILLARLLVAFKELCPSLKQCVIPAKSTESISWQDDDHSLSSFVDSRTDNWTKIAGLLDEESLRLWKLWVEEFEKQWPQLEKHVGYQTVLVDFPLWDTVSIEEKDEQNQSVQSTIRVPALPSFALQKLLHTIATNLSTFIPHTIPKSILIEIVERIVTRLSNHYRNLSTLEFVQKNQNSALQYYFDLKFVQLLFTSREKKQHTEEHNQLIDVFKGYIDPFDFDVFHMHVTANVKRAVQRMQHFFGVLIVNRDHLSTTLSSSSTAGVSDAAAGGKFSQDKNPNILAVSSNSSSEIWFPLLPIVTKETSTVRTAGMEPVGFAETSTAKRINFLNSD